MKAMLIPKNKKKKNKRQHKEKKHHLLSVNINFNAVIYLRALEDII